MASIRTKRRIDGTVAYHVQVRVKGYPPQTATFERKTDAKHWAEQVETEMRQRRFFTVFEAERHTLRLCKKVDDESSTSRSDSLSRQRAAE